MRQISDEDAEKIADVLMEKIVERAQKEAGKGMFAYLSKLFWGAVLALVAYGASRYGSPG